MRTTGRLALLGSFAAAGVGVALCVGMSSNAPEPEPTSKPADLAAVIRTVDDAAVANRQLSKQPPDLRKGEAECSSAETGRHVPWLELRADARRWAAIDGSQDEG